MLPTPYFANDKACLYQADALAVLKALPDASVDALVTDPPYSSGGMVRGDRTADPSTKYVPTKEVVNFHATFTGDNRDQRAYAEVAERRIRTALGQVVPKGGQDALDFGEAS